MPIIHLTTIIKAPVQRVFDLSRSISLHIASMHHTSERAVAGVTSGLIQLSETVTWEASHLFKRRYLTTQITAMQLYSSFTDEMIKGDFKIMKHVHLFKPVVEGTIMEDQFTFQSPYGLAGSIVDRLFLKRYMQQLLQSRNAVIKDYAESGKWKQVL